jgi:hypothetical protein
MRTRTKVAAFAAAVAAASVLPAAGALASTPGCTSGWLSGFCATQADNGTPVLVMDAKGDRAAYGNPVIGWSDSSTDQATDWFSLQFQGDNSLGVMFAFAPGGHVSGMCASDPGDGLVVERPCNGSAWQRWVAAQVGTGSFFTWTNRATHRILTASVKGGQLTTTPATATPGVTAQWKFSA